MDDPLLVRGREPLRDLDRELDTPFARERSRSLELVSQRLTVEELHDGVGNARGEIEIVDGENVRMGERGHGFCFPLEASTSVRALAQMPG